VHFVGCYYNGIPEEFIASNAAGKTLHLSS